MCAQRRQDGAGHRLSYQPALDGMRALAVMAVLAYHAGLPWARGGFLGVDAFFVLSGYLITSLLLTEWRSRGSIDLLAFWARRARRLLPALFLMLLGVAFYALFLAGPLELGKIRGDALATIAYVANWRPIFAGQSYFDQFVTPSPLRHTWSLGIEEQYYAIWPLIVSLVLLGLPAGLRRGSLRPLLTVSIVLLAGSALLMALLFQPGHDPSRAYYGTDTRAQSLLVGATLAMLLFRFGPLRGPLLSRTLQIAALACVAGLAWSWTNTPSNSAVLYRGGFLLLAIGVAIVIAAAVQPRAGPAGRALSIAPLRAVGLISYGVYLWHWPVYLVLSPGRVGWGQYELFALRVVVTLLIATVSYHLIELPIRRGAFQRLKMSWALAPAGAVAVATVLVFFTRGALSPVAPSAAAMPQVDTTTADVPLRAMVLGDSMSMSLEPGLTEVGKESNLSVWNPSILLCGFVREDTVVDLFGNVSRDQAERCERWRQKWPSHVEAFDPDVVVMLFGAWDYRDHVVNSVTLETGTAEWDAYVLSELQKETDVLTAWGAKLLLVTWPCSRPEVWTEIGDTGVQATADALWRIDRLDALYRQFAEQHPDKVRLIDLNAFACPKGTYTDLVVDGVRLREDGTHFTPESSYIVARWLVPRITDAARSRP
ncbi:MAG TPA: acyltransferase family protein [Dehalococcoidia bacterium]|nr:acyltransferase family protein [Dehalococcoidia bacterium]